MWNQIASSSSVTASPSPVRSPSVTTPDSLCYPSGPPVLPHRTLSPPLSLSLSLSLSVTRPDIRFPPDFDDGHFSPTPDLLPHRTPASRPTSDGHFSPYTPDLSPHRTPVCRSTSGRPSGAHQAPLFRERPQWHGKYSARVTRGAACKWAPICI